MDVDRADRDTRCAGDVADGGLVVADFDEAGSGGFTTPSLTLASGKTGTLPAVLPGATPELVAPQVLTRAPGGDLLITDNVPGDSRSNRVLRLSSVTGELSLVLGGGSFGDGGDGGAAGLARIGQIGRPDISSDGGLVVADLVGRITFLDKNNKVYAHVGDNPDPKLRGRNGIPRAKWNDGEFLSPHSVCVDGSGHVYVMDWNSLGRISKLTHVTKKK